MKRNIILSLFDYTGNWSRPYKESGYEVIQVDIQHGTDILSWNYKQIPRERVYGILAAVPCTDFAISGARHFARKDADGTTEQSKKLVYKTLEIIEYFNPVFWVVENPMSRYINAAPSLARLNISLTLATLRATEIPTRSGTLNATIKPLGFGVSLTAPPKNLWRHYKRSALCGKNTAESQLRQRTLAAQHRSALLTAFTLPIITRRYS